MSKGPRPMFRPSEIDKKLEELIHRPRYPLTKWEEAFVESVMDQRTRTRSSSDKQNEIVERIYEEKVLGERTRSRRYD